MTSPQLPSFGGAGGGKNAVSDLTPNPSPNGEGRGF